MPTKLQRLFQLFDCRSLACTVFSSVVRQPCTVHRASVETPLLAYFCCLLRHAVLLPEAGGIRCQDAGSLNGTFVNEDRLEDIAVLGDGDVLQVGQTVVQITR